MVVFFNNMNAQYLSLNLIAVKNNSNKDCKWWQNCQKITCVQWIGYWNYLDYFLLDIFCYHHYTLKITLLIFVYLNRSSHSLVRTVERSDVRLRGRSRYWPYDFHQTESCPSWRIISSLSWYPSSDSIYPGLSICCHHPHSHSQDWTGTTYQDFLSKWRPPYRSAVCYGVTQYPGRKFRQRQRKYLS